MDNVFNYEKKYFHDLHKELFIHFILIKLITKSWFCFYFFIYFVVVVVVVIFVTSEFAGCRLMNKKWYSTMPHIETVWNSLWWICHTILVVLFCRLFRPIRAAFPQSISKNDFYCSRKCSPNTSTQDWFPKTYKLCPASMGKRTSNRWK